MKSGWNLKKSNTLHILWDHISVAKVFLGLGITLSALAGYLLFFPVMDKLFWITACSTLLICSGSGALNNYQERYRDKLLIRTAGRPLPCGRLLPQTVLIQAFLLMAFGILGFCFTRNPVGSVMSALVGVILYNGIYTPLKFHTLLSIVPGSICGMIPPFMGWCAAGGNIFPFQSPVYVSIASIYGIFFVMLLMGVWQLPHFWLILLSHGSDYFRSGMPSMLSFLTESQLKRVLLVWIFFYCLIMMMAPLWLVNLNGLIQWVFIINAMAFLVLFLVLHLIGRARCFKVEFMLLNSSMVIFIFTIMINQLIFY